MFGEEVRALASSAKPARPAGRETADEAAGLLARIAEGEEEALIALYARLAGVVHATCRRILTDVDEARDATSEVFFRVWSRASSFDRDRSSGTAWILLIARRLSLDRLRSNRRRDRMLRRFEQEQPAAATSHPDAVARVRVAAALGRLSEADRRILLAAYFEGLSGADIAERDALPLGTVKSRLRAALARLRVAFLRGGTA